MLRVRVHALFVKNESRTRKAAGIVVAGSMLTVVIVRDAD